MKKKTTMQKRLYWGSQLGTGLFRRVCRIVDLSLFTQNWNPSGVSKKRLLEKKRPLPLPGKNPKLFLNGI